MDDAGLLTLEQAATRTGYRKSELRSLVREGRLPAVRSGKRWQVATSDLAALPSRLGAPPDPPHPPVEVAAVEVHPGKVSDPVIALIDLLRERDQKLTELLEERSQLTGQVGFLLGQLSEREERIQRLEQAALTAPPVRSVNVLPADSGPVALLDEWTRSPCPDSALGKSQSPADQHGDPGSTLPAASAPSSNLTEGSGIIPVAGPEPIALTATTIDKPPAPLDPPSRPRRGLLGLFRRRAAV